MAPLLLCATLLLLLCVRIDITSAQTIVETLPGFPGKLPFKLETGYIGVGDSENGQIFYYFFESERNPKDDPLVIFLTGGPGCSAMRTIVYEIGPFTFGNTISNDSIPTLELKPYSWTKVSNLLLIDQPVGTGFSYGKSWEAYINSDTKVADLTYQFLKKWLMVHPEFLKNPLYVGGVSYAGIFAPLIVEKIYSGNEDKNDDLVLNIKGYFMGNPISDKYSDFNGRVKYARGMGLLSHSIYESAKENCKGNYSADPTNMLCQNDLQKISECLDKICLPNILDSCCNGFPPKNLSSNLLLPSSKTKSSTSVPKVRGSCTENNLDYIWANHRTVQEALHIREGTITEWMRCNKSTFFAEGIDRTEAYIFNVQKTGPVHQNLTYKRARALIYSGDHDMVVPHTSTEEWIESLRLTVESDWRPWFVNGAVAGYTVKYSHLDYELTYATLKGAGHVAIELKPEEGFSIIKKWLAGDSL